MSLGILYIVATPIGNLNDFSSRAIKTLNEVDYIAAEDTRHSQKLLKHFDIETPMVSLHKFNEHKRYEKVLKDLLDGKNIALISDAGTPLISDPGYRLVYEAREKNIEVIAIPGPCAAIAALSISGLPSNQFIFEGFLPVKQNARIKQLTVLKQEARTIIFYEAPHRVLDFLKDLLTVFGGERYVVVTRELTKIHETVYAGKVEKILEHLKYHTEEQCGEFVILVKGAEQIKMADDEVLRVLKILLKACSVKQAVQFASEITGERKNVLYQMALEIQK